MFKLNNRNPYLLLLMNARLTVIKFISNFKPYYTSHVMCADNYNLFCFLNKLHHGSKMAVLWDVGYLLVD